MILNIDVSTQEVMNLDPSTVSIAAIETTKDFDGYESITIIYKVRR